MSICCCLAALGPSSSSTTKAQVPLSSVSLTSCSKPGRLSMARSHFVTGSSSVPSSLCRVRAVKPMSRTQSESGDEPAPGTSRALSPLSIVNQTNQRLRNSKFSNSPNGSPKIQSSISTDNYFDFKVNNISASSGTIGLSGTLEVLYEDPQEQSDLFNFENDAKRLISDEDLIDIAYSMPNLEAEDQTEKAWKLLDDEISDILNLRKQFSSQLSVYFSL